MNNLLSDQLKTRTSAAHQQLEKALVQRMRSLQTINDYLILLQFFYSYFGAVEERINLYIGSVELPDYPQRRKTAALAGDILCLGGTLPEKTPVNDLPEIKNHMQAFGALYVLEGSTLGGMIICQMIRKQLGLTETGLSFFYSYGENLATMWDTFKLTLNRQATKDADEEIVIAAADATFSKFSVLLAA